MNEVTKVRWDQLWRRAGAQIEGSAGFEELKRLYSEPHRHYHNFDHIADCLREFDSGQHLAEQPLAVELAIWFHDAIYNPRAADNEEKSAELANQRLTDAGTGKALRETVVQLVLATKHHDVSLNADAPLLVDVDLSILGQAPDRFWAYESQIRQEYEWVPEKLFAEKRAEILERFLQRKTIYATELFRAKYERSARANLNASVLKLRVKA